MSKKEKIIIIGPSGSGKDHLMRKLVEKGLRPCIKYTTRPIRNHEINGITYHFINDSEFIKNLKENKFLTHQSFEVLNDTVDNKVWYYGIPVKEFEESQVFIMTPGELNNLDIDCRKRSFIVYLDIDRSTREDRLLKREDKNDSIKRRLNSDDIDFKCDFYYDLRVKDPEFSSDDIYDLMD